MSYNAEEWFRNGQVVTHKEWDRYRERLSDELDVPDGKLSPVLTQPWPGDDRNPPHLGNNGRLFIPDNTVPRLRKATDPFEEFKLIISETTENLTGNNTPSDDNIAKVGNHLLSYFQGDVILDKLDGSKLEKPTELEEYNSTSVTSVVITSVNDDGYEDWEIYTPENPNQFFDPIAGSNSHMFKRLRTSELTPTTIADVAVEVQSQYPPQSFRPKNSFVARERDKYDTTLYGVSDPKKFFTRDTTQADSGIAWQKTVTHPYWLHAGIRW